MEDEGKRIMLERGRICAEKKQGKNTGMTLQFMSDTVKKNKRYLAKCR